MEYGKAWISERAYTGEPKLSDFKLISEEVSTALKPGEFLVEALYLTVDPYMRLWPVEVGSVLQGEQVGRVKASENPKFPVGCLVQFHHGWRTLSVISPDMHGDNFGLMLQRLPDLKDLSPSLALGVLGMPGMTAYFGMQERGKPKPGETVVISGAAGAVGQIAGQLAKIGGAKVIGSAGTDEKCEVLRQFGFDHVFNYKKTAVGDAMKEFAPEGVDLYFDNVGGDFALAVLQHMKKNGRMIICGAISTYNSTRPEGYPGMYELILSRMLTVYGIIGWSWFDRFPEGVAQLKQWIEEGKLKYTETIVEGFEKMPEAFISLFKGSNTGKLVVKV